MQNDNIKGALLLTLSCLIMCVDNSIIHTFGFYYEGIHSDQIFFIKVSSCLILVTLTILSTDYRLFFSQCLRFQLLRSFFGGIGNLFWIKALTSLPISYAVCLSMASVFFNYIGSIVIYKENYYPARFLCCLFGFAAIASSVRAEHIIFGLPVIFPLCSALCFSFASLIIKKVSQKDHILTTLFYLMVTMTLISLPGAYTHWNPLELNVSLPLSTLGLLYLGAQLCLVQSYKIAEITFISPFKFSKLPVNLLVGFFLFHETPSENSWIPLTVIILSSVFLFILESSKQPNKLAGSHQGEEIEVKA